MPKRPYAPKKHIRKGEPTARFGGGYIVFRDDLLKSDLRKVMEITAKTMGGLLVAEAKNNIRGIQFSKFPIRLAGDAVPEVGFRSRTSNYGLTDASRKSALLSSIVLDKAVRSTASKISVTVNTMANNFKDSHIGIYYEHGTGPYADGFTQVSGAKYEANPNRGGKNIYTRPGQLWTDLGGNSRISFAKKVQKVNGLAVYSYKWFEKAVKSTEKQFAKVLSEEMQHLHIAKYLQIKSTIVIGGRRHHA